MTKMTQSARKLRSRNLFQRHCKKRNRFRVHTEGVRAAERGAFHRLGQMSGVRILHVEYAERRRNYGILFIFSLFTEYMHLEYVRVPVIYRVNKAEYVIHIRVAASQEYVNTYSTRRVRMAFSGSFFRKSICIANQRAFSDPR